jgi:hypothetical protein
MYLEADLLTEVFTDVYHDVLLERLHGTEEFDDCFKTIPLTPNTKRAPKEIPLTVVVISLVTERESR